VIIHPQLGRRCWVRHTPALRKGFGVESEFPIIDSYRFDNKHGAEPIVFHIVNHGFELWLCDLL
jgi:hypothetical protein